MIKRLTGLLCAAAMMAGAPAFAQDDMSAEEAAVLKALDDALPGALIHNPIILEWDTRGSDIRAKVVDAAALPSSQAISARVKKRQNKAWDTVLTTEIPGAVAKGDEIEVYFWTRTAKAPKGADAADITIFVGRNFDPYDNIIAQEVKPAGEWKLVSLKGTANSDFPADSLKVEYQLGRHAQTVEVGPVYVSVLGKGDS